MIPLFFLTVAHITLPSCFFDSFDSFRQLIEEEPEPPLAVKLYTSPQCLAQLSSLLPVERSCRYPKSYHQYLVIFFGPAHIHNVPNFRTPTPAPSPPVLSSTVLHTGRETQKDRALPYLFHPSQCTGSTVKDETSGRMKCFFSLVNVVI